MISLSNVFEVNEKESIWIVNSNNELIADNPFHIINNKIFDTNEQLRDDILGRLIRRDISISKQNTEQISLYQTYFFLNENLEIKHRKNKKSLIDKFNIMIGNIYIKEEFITKDEIERIKSIYFMIDFENKNIFPYRVIETHNFFEKVKNINCLEKNKKEIIDSGAIDKHNYNGTLRKIFEKNNFNKNI